MVRFFSISYLFVLKDNFDVYALVSKNITHEDHLRREIRRVFLDIDRLNLNNHFQQNIYLEPVVYDVKKENLDNIITFLIQWSKYVLNRRILAASVFVTYARSVFCHSKIGVTEVKIFETLNEFISDKGDLHTFLKVFDKWSDTPVDQRKTLCRNSCLDYSYLEYVDDCVDRLKKIMENKSSFNNCDIPLRSLVSSLNKHIVALCKYEKIGYLSKTGKPLRVHSESIFQLANINLP